MTEEKKLKIIKIIMFSFLAIIFGLGLYKNFSAVGEKINIEKDKINLYFFYGDGCPHCAKEEKFLSNLEERSEDIKIQRFETWYVKENSALLKQIAAELGLTINGVPVLIIGEEAVVGFTSAETTGQRIMKKIEEIRMNGCDDPVQAILKKSGADERCEHGCDLSGACEHDCGCGADTGADKGAPERQSIDVPFLGEVSAKSVSLPVFTFLIAATDGFNPCAMWVLLFLISLLLNMEDKKRMWILGSSFILASGAVYFLFLSAWLSLFLFLGLVAWLRFAIGLTALFSGGYHLFDSYRNRGGGCHVINSEKRKMVFARLRALVAEKNFFLAILGIVSLAVAVNLVELVCSAGLPAVYTQVLAMASLPAWQYYAYLLLYILVFMLDDLLIFFIAMTTLRMKALNSGYTAWAGWVGGILMLLIGILLIFKPEWIMFA